MIYKSFTIKNYKGIHEVTIDLANNRIITIVGLNESGKTSIMEAIELFYKMIKDFDATEEVNSYRPKGISYTGNISLNGILLFEKDDIEKIQNYWRYTLKKKTVLEISEEFVYDINFRFKLHAYKSTNTTCNVGIRTKNSQRRLYLTDKKSWKELILFIKKYIVPEILFYDDFIFQIPEQIYFKKQASQ